MTADEHIFKAGEMARMLNISKQTLNFYLKKELLEPSEIADNNYKYFTIAQYRLLEIIINLRKFDFSIQEIKEYLNHRSLEKLDRMIRNKHDDFSKKICFYQSADKQLRRMSQKIFDMQHIILDRVTLTQHPPYSYILSEEIPENMPIKNKIRLRIQFMQHLISRNALDIVQGWTISKDRIVNKEFSGKIRYFAIIEDEETLVPDVFSAPASLSCSVCSTGNYHTCRDRLFTQLLDFISLNRLEISGDARIVHIKDYWYTDDTEKYIIKISLPVK